MLDNLRSLLRINSRDRGWGERGGLGLNESGKSVRFEDEATAAPRGESPFLASSNDSVVGSGSGNSSGENSWGSSRDESEPSPTDTITTRDIHTINTTIAVLSPEVVVVNNPPSVISRNGISLLSQQPPRVKTPFPSPWQTTTTTNNNNHTSAGRPFSSSQSPPHITTLCHGADTEVDDTAHPIRLPPPATPSSIHLHLTHPTELDQLVPHGYTRTRAYTRARTMAWTRTIFPLRVTPPGESPCPPLK